VKGSWLAVPASARLTVRMTDTGRPLTPPARVLVVDDERDTADSTGWLLRLWGFDARVCYDAADALAVAQAFRPHMVVADVVMSRVDGLGLVRGLRERLRLVRLGLIAVTGRTDPATRRRCADMGFHFFLVKPFDHDGLKAAVTGLAESVREA
jgi:DNA-binding response OmpR family regulator